MVSPIMATFALKSNHANDKTGSTCSSSSSSSINSNNSNHNNMDPTEQEREWAMAIKRAAHADSTIEAELISDFEFLQHAIVAKHQVTKALGRIRKLQKFKTDYGIDRDGSFEQAVREWKQFQTVLHPDFILSMAQMKNNHINYSSTKKSSQCSRDEASSPSNPQNENNSHRVNGIGGKDENGDICLPPLESSYARPSSAGSKSTENTTHSSSTNSSGTLCSEEEETTFPASSTSSHKRGHPCSNTTNNNDECPHVFCVDLAKAKHAKMNTLEAFAISLRGIFYILQSMSSNIPAIRSGYCHLGDTLGIGAVNFSLQSDRRNAELYSHAYPVRIRQMVLLNATLPVRIFYSLVKVFATRQTRQTVVFAGDRDEFLYSAAGAQHNQRHGIGPYMGDVLPHAWGGTIQPNALNDTVVARLRERYENVATFRL